MNARLRRRWRVAWFVRVLALSALIVLLWRLRPALPPLPRSLSAPLTLETVEGAAGWLLWLLANAVLLVQLQRAVRVRGHPRSGTARWSRVPARERPDHLERSSFALPAMPQLRIPAAAPSQPRSETLNDSSGENVLTQEADERVAPSATSRLRVGLLGPLEITGTKRSRRGLRAAALELIAYLALQRRAVHRDELLEAFWPGADPRRTRLRLRQAARDARRLLGPALRSERDGYALDPTMVESDVDELERLLTSAATAEPQQGHQLREQALALFRGEPLADRDYLWSEGELRRLRATHVELLEHVGRDRLGQGDAGGALQAAERGLELDALNETLWRLALEAESALGLREAVAQRYERLQSLLRQRVGLEPARETRLLHRQLLGQH